MRPALFAASCIFLASATLAQQTDPLKTPACKQAQADLQAQTTAMAAAAKGRAAADAGAPARLKTLQQNAARVCLGSRLDAPAPARHTSRVPIKVAPVTGPTPGRKAPAAVASPPAVQNRPLTAVTSCDNVGCWASDGTRLQKVGPNLLGPRGVCTVQGAILNCP
jgi:hypothetical protein